MPGQRSLEDIVESGSWSQFQLYGVVHKAMKIERVGRVLHVHLMRAQRLACLCDLEFQSRGTDTWEAIKPEEPYLIPGSLGDLRYRLTPAGRLLLHLDRPHSQVVILFPELDTGPPERDGLVRFRKLNLDDLRLAADARPEAIDPDRAYDIYLV